MPVSPSPVRPLTVLAWAAAATEARCGAAGWEAWAETPSPRPSARPAATAAIRRRPRAPEVLPCIACPSFLIGGRRRTDPPGAPVGGASGQGCPRGRVGGVDAPPLNGPAGGAVPLGGDTKSIGGPRGRRQSL